MIDIDENDEIAQQFNIKSVPTFYLYKKKEFIGQTGGADINALDDLGWTPLHAACSAGHTSIVYYLLISVCIV